MLLERLGVLGGFDGGMNLVCGGPIIPDTERQANIGIHVVAD
jgi:hypothetical protein